MPAITPKGKKYLKSNHNYDTELLKISLVVKDIKLKGNHNSGMMTAIVSPVVKDIKLKGNHNTSTKTTKLQTVVKDINLKGNHNGVPLLTLIYSVVNDIDFYRIQCQGDNFLLGFLFNPRQNCIFARRNSKRFSNEDKRCIR